MPPSLDDVIAEIDQWFADEVQRAPLSYNTEIYNQMYAARASLRNRVAVAITGEPFDPPAPPSEEPENAEEPEAGAQGSNGAEDPEKPAGEAEGAQGAAKVSTKPKTGN